MGCAGAMRLSLAAFEYECPDLDIAPSLNFRARKNGLSTVIESFVYFEEKFFWGRGSNPTVRLRFDSDEPVTCKEEDCAYGTTKASLHFDKLEVFQNSTTKGRLLLQVLPVRGHSLLARFDLQKAKPAIEGFAEAVLGHDFRPICSSNAEILDWVLRLGPKNTVLKKKALSALGFDPGPVDYSKGAAFFEALQRYATSRNTSEIFGLFDGGTPRKSWHSALYDEAPSRIKREMGPLKIFD